MTVLQRVGKSRRRAIVAALALLGGLLVATIVLATCAPAPPGADSPRPHPSSQVPRPGPSGSPGRVNPLAIAS